MIKLSLLATLCATLSLSFSSASENKIDGRNFANLNDCGDYENQQELPCFECITFTYAPTPNCQGTPLMDESLPETCPNCSACEQHSDCGNENCP